MGARHQRVAKPTRARLAMARQPIAIWCQIFAPLAVKSAATMSKALAIAGSLGRLTRPQGLPLVAAAQPFAELFGGIAFHRQLHQEAQARRTRSPFAGEV